MSDNPFTHTVYIYGARETTPTAALEIVVGIAPLPVYVMQEAMAACNRLKLGTQWVSTNCGHTLIYFQVMRLGYTITTPSLNSKACSRNTLILQAPGSSRCRHQLAR